MLNKNLTSILKYEILIKEYVLSLSVYGDTMEVEVLSPYSQHINTQISPHNIINLF